MLCFSMSVWFYLCCKVFKNLSINLCFRNQFALSLDQFIVDFLLIMMMIHVFPRIGIQICHLPWHIANGKILLNDCRLVLRTE